MLWLLEIVAGDGRIVRKWHGLQRLFEASVEVKVAWDGLSGGARLPAGIYLARLKALSRDARRKGDPCPVCEGEVRRALACAEGHIEQAWDISVGIRGLLFVPMPAAAEALSGD